VNEEARRGELTVPSLDDWEKGWNEKLKAETLKPEMPMPGNIVSMVKLAA